MTKVKDVVELFKKGYNCAQSMLAVYGAELGIDHKTALRIGNAFGGGIAKRGETCGAVTGALMIIGLKYGEGDAEDRVSKEKTYERAEKFMREFEARNHSTACRKLLGFEIGSNNDDQQNTVISQRCPQFVKDAAEIIEDMLES